MGPAFDTIGMALDMWTEITVSRAEKFSFTCEGDGADELPLDETNLVVVGVKKAFEYVGRDMVPLKYHSKNNIPFSRGLGSSLLQLLGDCLLGLRSWEKELRVFGRLSVRWGRACRARRASSTRMRNRRTP